MTERIIKQTTLTGTPEELQVRIGKMQSMGVKQDAIAGGKKEMSDFATRIIQGLK